MGLSINQKNQEVSKKDRRIRKSQELIKKAMIELMAKKDFDSITIQNIADKADVSRGTIYLHYTDKYDLVEKMIAEHIDILYDLNYSTAESDHPSRSGLWAKYFERHFDFFSVILASRCAHFFHDQYMALLIALIRHDINVTGLKYQGFFDEEVIINWTASASVGLTEWWI